MGTTFEIFPYTASSTGSGLYRMLCWKAVNIRAILTMFKHGSGHLKHGWGAWPYAGLNSLKV